MREIPSEEKQVVGALRECGSFVETKLREVASIAGQAAMERDVARQKLASCIADLRDRRTGYALEEWMMEHSSCKTPGSEFYRGEEELELMAKLRTWWGETDDEGSTLYIIWRVPVSVEEGERIMRLWGMNPDPRSCHCAGDCCGHWFSEGMNVENDLLWTKHSYRNV